MSYEGKDIDPVAMDFAKGKDWMDICSCPVAGYYFIKSESGFGEAIEISDDYDAEGVEEIIKFIPSKDEKESLGLQDWSEVYLFGDQKGNYKVKQTLK
jgi:hypothetical protein